MLDIIKRFKKNGSRFRYQESSSVIQSYAPHYTYSPDHNESYACRQKLEETINQTNTMMTEIHHRVKNNLAAVSGLLQLQWLQETDPKIAEKFKDSYHRVNAIARIHEQLYQSGQFTNVNLAENLEKLVVSIIDTMKNGIDIELDINCVPVHLDTKEILPLSLIASEVVTNVMKYAFPGREKGRIEVSLDEVDSRIELVIRDNGIGLPDDFETRKKSSIGMNLIESLTNQLKADYNYESSPEGTAFSLSVQRFA